MKAEPEVLRINDREVTITNPGKVFFAEAGVTKLDLVRYYLAVADGALRGVRGRPMALKRFVNGAAAEAFFQKRAPDNRPDWLRVATLSFPSGRTADEIVVDDAAGLAWIVNLGCIDLNPHPVRADDMDHPDELRVDLDPVPGIEWAQIRDVAMVTKEALDAVGLVGWPKTSGSRGIHINVRIERRWTYPEVRRAALAIARDVVNNRAVAKSLTDVTLEIESGKNLTQSFQNTGMFPPLVIRMLKVGEATGSLDKALLNVSYFYDRDVKDSIKKVQVMIEPTMTLILGALLGWVMLSVLSPIYDIIGKVQF